MDVWKACLLMEVLTGRPYMKSNIICYKQADIQQQYSLLPQFLRA